jgi:hypothetical protein
VKTVRVQPWYVNRASFYDEMLDQITVYVLLGPENNEKPARFFIAKDAYGAARAHYPEGWSKNGFLKFKAVENYENRWELLRD